MQNETYNRYKFFTRIQQEGESFDNFLTDVKVLVSDCNFGELEDSLLRDKIVSGILDLSIQERLLQNSSLTLKIAENICRAAEVSKIQVKEIRSDKGVDLIKHKEGARYKAGKKEARYQEAASSVEYDCLKCGQHHSRMKCPAYGKICNNCKRMNHFAVGCKFRE